MKKKQVWSMILVAAVGAGMLAGCGNSGAAATTAATATTAKQTTEAKAEETTKEAATEGRGSACTDTGRTENGK